MKKIRLNCEPPKFWIFMGDIHPDWATCLSFMIRHPEHVYSTQGFLPGSTPPKNHVPLWKRRDSSGFHDVQDTERRLVQIAQLLDSQAARGFGDFWAPQKAKLRLLRQSFGRFSTQKLHIYFRKTWISEQSSIIDYMMFRCSTLM